MSWNNFAGGGQQYGGAPTGYAYGTPSAPPGVGQAPAGYAGAAPPLGQQLPPGQGYAPPGQQPQGYAPPAGYAPGYGPTPGQQQTPQGYASGGYGAPPPQQQQYGAPTSYGQPPAGYAGGGFAPQQAQPPPGISPDLWQWFQAVDADKSGKITTIELQQALMNGNWTPFNEETCRLMIGMFDRDKNGTIDIHEFSSLWKYIQDWKSCFDRFDTDRSGNINAVELFNAFRTFGYNLTQNFCNLCVRVFDRKHTNTMNFDDFIQCCVMLKSLTDQFRQKDTNQSGMIRIHYEEFLQMVLDNATVL